MKLKGIEIAGFRAFASKRHIDLSADATVIVGVNGLGKTSLLDAILWGLCGSVDRVGTDDKLVSLYSETGDARVSVQLVQSNGEEVTISRRSDGTSQSLRLSTGGQDFKESSAEVRLFELLWPNSAFAADGSSAFTSALVRSVYLQQDRVRDFLEAATDQERFNIVSELVGAGRLTELQLQLEKERTNWTRATNQRAKDEKPLATRVSDLERQLQKLKQSSEMNSDDSTPPWPDWWESAAELGITTPVELPPAASVEASHSLDNALHQVQSLRSQNGRRRDLASSLRRLIAEEPAQPRSSVDALREEHHRARNEQSETRARLDAARKQAAENRKLQVQTSELKEQQRALAQIALKLLGDRCPVCTQSYDFEQTKSRLEQIAKQENPETVSKDEPQDLVADLAAIEEKVVETVREAKRALDEAESQIELHNNWLSERDRLIGELELQSIESEMLFGQIAEIIADCTQRDGQLVAHRKAGEQLSLNLARESAKSRIAAVEHDLEEARKELAAQRVIVKSRELTGVIASLLLDALREAASRITVDRLRQIEPFLQRVYARIDPHPAFRVVKLATRFSRGRGRLDTQIHDNAEGLSSDNPTAVLSSSQLNALAVSLFLSLNLTLPRLPIEAALLDDPIQSLDDINLLGLVDLLRRTKDKRQLLVSTHDARFGKLLSRKLRPSCESQTTSVIELSGWSRSGPEVRQYAIQPDARFRLVGAS